MRIKLSILILLIFTVALKGQTKEELKIKDFFWGENDTHKNTYKIPEKWKNESAVILYKNQNYDFHSFAAKVTYTTSVRKRIKLLDKSAVKEFSEFSFSDLIKPPKKVIILPIPIGFNVKQKSGNYVAIKVIKPSGEEIEIDIEKESVQVDEQTKIAIANLAVGDIIDYYIYKEDPFLSPWAFGFDPVETTLSEDYPILDYKLFFETENDFFINFNSYNGAPDLKEITTKKKSVRRYSLEDSNIEKTNSPRWYYPLIELPTYKFQVYFARSGKFEDRALAFLPEKENIIKKNVSKEEVLELYDTRFKPEGDIDNVTNFLEGKSFKSDAKKVSEAYYYMRHYYLTRFIEAIFIDKANIMENPYDYYGKKSVFIDNQKQFIRHFLKFLKREKIDFEIVIGKKRFDGTIDDLLIEENVEVLLKIKTETPLYLEYFGSHTAINQFSPLLEDTNVYLLSATKNKIDIIKEGKLPTSSQSQNESKTNITLNFDTNLSDFTITLVRSFKGHQKEDQQYDRLLFTDYTNEDYKKYKTTSFINLIKKKKDKIKYKKELEALIVKLEEKRKDRFKKGIETEFELNEHIKDYSFKINEMGRYGLDSYFTYTESFKGKNAFIKKAGSNYIVEIGKLITEQIDLTEKQRERTENIHMPYPRSYNNKITFNIPDGYSVHGIDKLNTNVTNVTGAFISDAKIEGNKLIITTSKEYKNYFQPNSNWQLMVAFLDAANQFTNEKILLKKN